MKKNWIIGMDVAGNGVQYQIQNQEGEVLAEGFAAKSMAGFSSLRLKCDTLGLEWTDTLVVVEATGRHHLCWCERLLAEGSTVYALNPLLASRLHTSDNAIRDNKDDRLDAEKLCETGRIRGPQLHRFTYKSECGKLKLNALATSRKVIRNQCTNILKSAGDLLQLVFPETKSLKLSLTSAGFRRLLQKAPTPDRIAALPIQEVRRAVGDKAEKLLDLAQNSFTPEEVASACSPALQGMLVTIDGLFEQITQLEQQIELALKRDQASGSCARLIRSLPGFGEVSASILAGFLPQGFEQWGTKKKIASKLQAYFGCDPRRRDSGTFKGKVKMSKRGIEIVRTALYQASFCGIKYDSELRAYYDKKKAEGDHHNKVVIDLIRKNIRRLVAVLVDQKPYEPLPKNA